MPLPRPRRLPPIQLAALVLVALVLVALAGRGCARAAIEARLRHEATARGLDASWRRLGLGFPLRVRLVGLALVRRASGDTTFSAETLAVTLDPWQALLLRARPDEVTLAHARARVASGGAAAADTLDPETRPSQRPDRSARVRRRADAVVRTLMLPARRLPRLALRDVTVEREPAPDEDTDGPGAALHLEALDLRRGSHGMLLSCRGRAAFEREVPFELDLEWRDDDRLDGGARIGVPDAATGRLDTLRIGVDGALTQDRARGVVRLADSTRVLVGEIPLFLSASVRRSGPAVSARLSASGLTQGRLFASLPRPVLGPLRDVAVAGSFDYRLSFDLDLARPDSVDFHADVLPHGLVLDGSRTRLELLGLDRPFTATIHLPRGRGAIRELSEANPHFLPLARIDTLLVHAVTTNEDGAFFRHRGFNLDAVKSAIADNIRAAAYRRGAGTITMQLARNLWLGHERTLSRKAQEVALAWVLEHLTGLSKERLLEIYLNVIEWGPEAHGADEAARFYFGHGAEHVSLDEALFLAIVVPSPSKWRWRLDPDGRLRPFARAQMHFIGRAMERKSWLAPGLLPPADSLRIDLLGPARDVLFPPDTTAARDSLTRARVAPDSAATDSVAQRPPAHEPI